MVSKPQSFDRVMFIQRPSGLITGSRFAEEKNYEKRISPIIILLKKTLEK